jgi:hypothetical protein
MKKVEISITDETGNVQLYDVSGLLQPITQMSNEDLYRYHTMCARATLYPNKTIEEVNAIIEDTLNKKKLQ